MARLQIVGRRRKGLALDHCHRTNRVRGIVCDGCNGMAGTADASHPVRCAVGFLRYAATAMTPDPVARQLMLPLLDYVGIADDNYGLVLL